MLHGMRERGELVQNERGLWVEGPVVDWEALPARVEGVIGERIARLPAALQETLKVASVEGEAFTAEVVARVRAVPELETVRQLSSTLDQRHRLVRSRGSQRLG
jgi:predicted ATPase